MNLSNKIQNIRKDNNLTQDELAEKLFVTRQAVSRWENGETTPSIETLKQILELFKIDAHSLFFGEMCQSCSCPLEQIGDLGTNADKTINVDYCKHCFEKGKFLSYETLEEAIADSINYAEMAGMTKEQMLAHASAVLPTLKRWKINLIREAEELLKKCPLCTVASVNENGYPRICVLAHLKTEGVKTFYFSTSTSSIKIQHFKKNSNSGVTFYAGGDSVSLTGEMYIEKDKKMKDSLWKDFLGKHFPNGGKDDPEYAIIKFVANEGRLYINGQLETVKI